MTTRIDLSQFERPTIPGLVLTVDEAHAGAIAWLASEFGWVLTEDASEPAWRVSRLLAAREVLLRQSIADGIAELSLAYATGENLTHIGATYYSLLPLPGESDDAYRLRLANAVERYAVGLSGPWYESVVRGVSGVSDARVTSPAPGEVTIYVLADGSLVDDMGAALYSDGIPDAALLAAVTGTVTADETRQQTDMVTVTACTRQLYDVTVTLMLLAEPDSARALTTARDALARLAARTDRLGAGLTSALVAGAAVDISAASAANIIIKTVSALDVEMVVDAIAGDDSVAPQHRHLVVDVA